jgi:hypothetical protein
MAYNATYTADDTSAVVIDGLSKILVAAIAFAALIGLVMVWRFFKGKKVM